MKPFKVVQDPFCIVLWPTEQLEDDGKKILAQAQKKTVTKKSSLSGFDSKMVLVPSPPMSWFTAQKRKLSKRDRDEAKSGIARYTIAVSSLLEKIFARFLNAVVNPRI